MRSGCQSRQRRNVIEEDPNGKRGTGAYSRRAQQLRLRRETLYHDPARKKRRSHHDNLSEGFPIHSQKQRRQLPDVVSVPILLTEVDFFLLTLALFVKSIALIGANAPLQ